LLFNTGVAVREYVPDWPGIDKFKGTFLHSSYWPKEGLDLEGKNVAVIGNGATGVQLSQELSQKAEKFYLFQRTPNTGLPMKQVDFAGDEQAIAKEDYAKLFVDRTNSFTGFNFYFLNKGTFEDTPEQRKEVYKDLWAQGDFQFWSAT
jgi:cation diffusion facilitator CzcD-associated flavoprotein CzcO